jgi:hypothetical protein
MQSVTIVEVPKDAPADLDVQLLNTLLLQGDEALQVNIVLLLAPQLSPDDLLYGLYVLLV